MMLDNHPAWHPQKGSIHQAKLVVNSETLLCDLNGNTGAPHRHTQEALQIISNISIRE